MILLRGKLEPREIKIMFWRYYYDLTLKEIAQLDGHKHGKERMRQIIKECLDKLRKRKFLTNDYL
jgi:DNA-directed RNA polymerase sigma subunit (sigma70/sigma32)